MTAKAGLNVPAIAKALGLYPAVPETMKSESAYMRNYGERVPFRGGNWSFGAVAGVFAVNLNYSRSNALSIIGGRPAFVI
ncbi:MAG: hypothetical protein WC247_00660, partial [Porticoccaceae bacterium]